MATTTGPALVLFGVHEETDPIAIPAVTEVLTATTCWLEEIVLTGATASRTVTITDGNDVPIISGITMDVGTIYQKELGSRKMPNGIKWVASGAGPIGYLRWKR